MNNCWHCKKEFGYWEVWRSYWKGWEIQCSSCRKRQAVDLDKRILLSSLITIPPFVLVLDIGYFFPSSNFSYRLMIYLILGFLLSLFVPLFKIYGE